MFEQYRPNTNSSVGAGPFVLKMMKAAVVTEFGAPLEIKDVPIPEPQGHQVLVEMEATGVCRGDVNSANGGWKALNPQLPRIPGHEGVGKVVKMGHLVTNLQLGERIGIPFVQSACLNCEFCIIGKEQLCMTPVFTGLMVNGTLAEFSLMDSRLAVKVPTNLDPVLAAPLFCAGLTTYKALKESQAKPGDWVSVVGVGGLGHLAVQYAKAMGLNVVAVVNPGSPSAAVARESGADLIYDGPGEGTGAFIQQKLGGVQAVILTAPAQKPLNYGIESLKKSGRVMVLGVPDEDFQVSAADLVFNCFQIVGSFVGNRKDLQEVLEFAARGKIKPMVVVKRLEDINEIINSLKEGGRVQGRFVCDFRA